MTDISIDDKLLIGILRRKMKAGYDKASLLMLIMGIYNVLEKGLKK